MSELFVSMLLYKKLIDKYYLVRKPVAIEDIELRHIDCILDIDGNLYMFNIIRDTVNQKAKIRNSKFGYKYSIDDRIEELEKYSSFFPKELFEDIIGKVRDGKYEDALLNIKIFGQLDPDNKYIKFLKTKIEKINFIEQIKRQIGELKEIPVKSMNNDISIEALDEIIGNKNNFSNQSFPFNFDLSRYSYFEDILQYEFIPRLIEIDAPTRVGWSISNNRLTDDTLNDNLELDTDIILDFISKVSPKMDQELYIKYIRHIIEKSYSERYLNSDLDFKKWGIENIKLYKVISSEDINYQDNNIPLISILAIRKFNYKDEKERYLFYKFDEESNTFQKKSYLEMVSLISKKELKVCNKFGKSCNELSNELEI